MRWFKKASSIFKFSLDFLTSEDVVLLPPFNSPDVKTSVTARHWWITLSFSKYNESSRTETLLNILWMILMNVLQTGRIVSNTVKFIQSAVPRAIHKPLYRKSQTSSQTDSKSCINVSDLPQWFFSGKRTCRQSHKNGRRGRVHKTAASTRQSRNFTQTLRSK